MASLLLGMDRDPSLACLGVATLCFAVGDLLAERGWDAGGCSGLVWFFFVSTGGVCGVLAFSGLFSAFESNRYQFSLLILEGSALWFTCGLMSMDRGWNYDGLLKSVLCLMSTLSGGLGTGCGTVMLLTNLWLESVGSAHNQRLGFVLLLASLTLFVVWAILSDVGWYGLGGIEKYGKSGVFKESLFWLTGFNAGACLVAALVFLSKVDSVFLTIS